MYVRCPWLCHTLPVWLWIRQLPRFNVLIHKMKVLPRQIQSKLHFRGYKCGTKLIMTIPWWSTLKTTTGNKNGLHHSQHLSASKLLLVLPVNTAATYVLLQVAVMGTQKPRKHWTWEILVRYNRSVLEHQ